MGLSVEVYSYDYKELKKAFTKHALTTDEDKIAEIMLRFGSVIGSRYIIVSNEFWADSNCWWNLPATIEEEFGVEDSFSMFFLPIVDRKELISAEEI